MSASENQKTPRGSMRPEVPKARDERGLSLTNLAERAALSVSYLSEVENGRKSPSLQVVQRLAAA